jgi:hypothetical protein
MPWIFLNTWVAQPKVRPSETKLHETTKLANNVASDPGSATG